ncbi:HesA/MoeB/ThiF family protein [Variovorax sp. VNK109]|uniref:HesA/MoeB/ThiF family protein n=1 Tax=Variovorax sp. VNK109 TaxID=3400919 RepID=UPI003C00B11C
MTDDQLLRYSRHLLLDEFSEQSQERLLAARALVVGAGGLGSPVALYLAAAGVGHITVADHDTVDLTNLQRQIAHTEQRVGMAKAESVRQAMAGLNSGVEVRALTQRAEGPLLDGLVASVDIVLDCCDNFSTRHAVNAACVRHGKPLVSGAAIRFDAQVSVFDSRGGTSPCYACLFPPDEAFEETRCATMGVFAPLVGIVGAMQAAEAIKLLAGIGESLAGRLLMLDARSMSWHEMRAERQPGCPVCGAGH